MPAARPGETKSRRSTASTARGAALGGGLALFAVFFGLTRTFSGLQVGFHPPFTASSPGELTFWLGFVLLLVPGAVLLGYGLSPAFAPPLEKAWFHLRSLSRSQRLWAFVLLFVLAALSARMSHRLILRDLPFTDDEYATRFGGQVLASGRVAVPEPEPFAAYSNLFLFRRGGKVTSVDWPGPVAAWAVSEATRTGPLVFALAAAAAAAAVAATCTVLFSPAHGLAAFLLFFLSPMAFLLSATTHAHLLSRAGIALAILGFVLARRKPSPGRWAAVGFFAAVAFTCRPVEASALLAPLVVDFAAGALRKRGSDRAALGFFALGAALPLALFFLYNGLVTGNPALPPRFFMEGPGETISGESIGHRFGANTGYNLLMLAIWFLGPAGIAAFAFGVGRSRLNRLLGLGVGLNLLAGLLHDNQGLHAVGPIHYSECAVPLAIIVLSGLAAIKSRLARAGLPPPVFAAAVSGLLLFGMGTFIAWQAGALNAQARIQSEIYDGIERAVETRGGPPAVVIAPRFADVWRANPESLKRGTWVFEWRRARPDLSDDILIVQDVPGAAWIFREKFPDRNLFRMTLAAEPPYWSLEPAKP